MSLCALAPSGFARSLEIEVETMPLCHLTEDVADEHFKAIPYNLSPPVSE
jgi:hypothetical protein